MTTTRPPAFGMFPSRLHRPPAWTIASSGAISRITKGKSTSTPASMSCVETTKHGPPAFKPARIKSSFSRRCCGHMPVERWNTPAAPPATSSSYTVRAAFLVFTTHRAERSPRIRFATSSQLSFGSPGFGHSTDTRLSIANRFTSVGMISVAASFSSPFRFAWSICSGRVIRKPQPFMI